VPHAELLLLLRLLLLLLVVDSGWLAAGLACQHTPLLKQVKMQARTCMYKWSLLYTFQQATRQHTTMVDTNLLCCTPRHDSQPIHAGGYPGQRLSATGPLHTPAAGQRHTLLNICRCFAGRQPTKAPHRGRHGLLQVCTCTHMACWRPAAIRQLRAGSSLYTTQLHLADNSAWLLPFSLLPLNSLYTCPQAACCRQRLPCMAV
jgi:hypothetical protein